MTGAGKALQAAAAAALKQAPGMGAVYEWPPIQAAAPYALVESGPESDWSYKGGEGREVRIAISLFDKGERPERLHRNMAAAENAAAGISEVEGWQLVTLLYLRSRIVRTKPGGWTGIIEYRARMLKAEPI